MAQSEASVNKPKKRSRVGIVLLVILLILNCGSIMSVGWEQILLMQNPLNTETSEIISTYTYKVGLQDSDFSYSTSIGLFNSIVNFLLLVIVNWIAGRVGEVSLW